MRQLVLHRSSGDRVTARQHLSPAAIAGFIDQTLAADERVHVAEHLADCGPCRDEVAACMRLVESNPVASRRQLMWRLAAGTAAVLVLAIALRSATVRNRTPAVNTERSVGGTDRIATVFPTDEALVSRSKLRLMWQRDDRATAYNVVITESNGKPVYSGEVTDTSLTPPDTARLIAGARYYWRVDVLHDDGSSAHSREIAFRLTP